MCAIFPPLLPRLWSVKYPEIPVIPSDVVDADAISTIYGRTNNNTPRGRLRYSECHSRTTKPHPSRRLSYLFTVSRLLVVTLFAVRIPLTPCRFHSFHQFSLPWPHFLDLITTNLVRPFLEGRASSAHNGVLEHAKCHSSGVRRRELLVLVCIEQLRLPVHLIRTVHIPARRGG